MNNNINTLSFVSLSVANIIDDIYGNNRLNISSLSIIILLQTNDSNK